MIKSSDKYNIDLGSPYGKLFFNNSGIGNIIKFINSSTQKKSLILKPNNLLKKIKDQIPQLDFIKLFFKNNQLIIDLNFKNKHVIELINIHDPLQVHKCFNHSYEDDINTKIWTLFLKIKKNYSQPCPVIQPTNHSSGLFRHQSRRNQATVYLVEKFLDSAEALPLNPFLFCFDRFQNDTDSFVEQLTSYLKFIDQCEYLAKNSYDDCRNRGIKVPKPFYLPANAETEFDKQANLKERSALNERSLIHLEQILGHFQLNQRLENLKQWMIELHHDQTVYFFNSILEQTNYLLPLPLMALVLKKYRCPRLGEITTSKMIYEKILAAFQDHPDKELYRDELGLVASDWMLVIQERRMKKTQNDNINIIEHINYIHSLEEIHKSHLSIHTANALIQAYLEENLVDKAEMIFEDLGDIKNEWTYDLTLHYHFKMYQYKGLTYFKNTLLALDEETKNSCLEGACIRLIKFLKNAKFDWDKSPNNLLNTIKSYFDLIPPAIRANEIVQREMISVYIEFQEFNMAWQEFEKIENPQQPTYDMMIEMFRSRNKSSSNRKSIELLNRAISDGLYASAHPNWNEEKTICSVDFHSYYVKRWGGPSYSSYSEKVLAAMLVNLHEQISNMQNYDYRPIQIQLICGQGTGKVINFVQDFVQNTFDWEDCDISLGSLTYRL
jgi:hypothetical protein